MPSRKPEGVENKEVPHAEDNIHSCHHHVDCSIFVGYSGRSKSAPDSTRPMPPQGSGNIQQLPLTPDVLYQHITALQQQVAELQAQVNALRSVVQVSQNGTTIQAEYLVIHGIKNLSLTSSKKTELTAADDLNLTSGTTLSLKGAQHATMEGAATIKFKAPQIRLNDGTQPLALVGSNVSGGKVATGSTSVLAK